MAKLSKLLKNKFFLGAILFLFVFLIFAFSVNKIWFKLDDLGSIINGLIRSPRDFFRIFCDDCRYYMTPMNYTFSKPNFISALYRPIQFIFFSITYFFAGLNAYYFYLVNVTFHALNTVLIFYLFSFWLPLKLSFLGGLLFAFYRDVSWLTWISILQNPLSTFFLLLTIIFFYSFLSFGNNKFNVWYYLSGLTLFLSFLSRENGVFFAFWAFAAVYLFFSDVNLGLWGRAKYALTKTWIFFFVNFLYVCLRMWAFGFSTLVRTYNNLFLRFPILTKLFKNKVANISDTVKNVSKNLSQVVPLKTDVASNVVLIANPAKISFFESFLNKLSLKVDTFWHWVTNILNIDVNSFSNKIFAFFLVLFLFIFTICSYRKHKKLLFFLFIGFFLFAWPGIIAYPNPRYINSVYPLLIFTFLLGMHFFSKENYLSIKRNIILGTCFSIVFGGVFYGIHKNIKGVQIASRGNLKEREKYDLFFKENSFPKGANFIVIGSPFVSDIQNIFQYFLNDLNLKLASVLMSTLAQKGCMGCRGDYRIQGVKSKIEPVKIDGKVGYRLTSLDKDHCAWWMDFSTFPLKWSKEEKAYIWSQQRPVLRGWNDFSLGRFFIHERLQDRYVTDVTFLFDSKWIDKNTIFVTWDTMEGKYKVLS